MESAFKMFRAGAKIVLEDFTIPIKAIQAALG